MDHSQTEESSDNKPPGERLITSTAVSYSPQQPSHYSPCVILDPSKLHVRIESNIEACRTIWNVFSPKISLFDLWEFRHAFWLGYQHKPYFICLESSDIEAVLPLWLDETTHKFSWFGSDWQEDNKFFAKSEKLIPMLLQLVPQNTNLNAISQNTIRNFNLQTFVHDEPKYTMNIDGWTSVDSLLVQLDKKHRYNFKRDHKLLSSMNPEIIVDDYNDFKTLRELNMRRFNKMHNNESSWVDPRRVKTFEAIIEYGKNKVSFSTRMLTVKINGIVAGVDLIAIYNNCYYPMVCGYNVEAFSGIGNYFTWIEIEDAINLGMKKIDVLEGNYGWKNKWFDEIPLFKFSTQ